VEPARRLLPRRLQLQRALHAQLLRRRRLRRLAGEVVLLLLQILRLVERGRRLRRLGLLLCCSFLCCSFLVEAESTQEIVRGGAAAVHVHL